MSRLNLCSAGYVLIVLLLTQQQHASKLTTDLIFACGGIGSILGAFAVGPLAKRFSVGQIMIIASCLWALTWLPFAFAPNPLVLGVAVAGAFLVVPVHASVQYGYRLTSTPDKLQGRVKPPHLVQEPVSWITADRRPPTSHWPGIHCAAALRSTVRVSRRYASQAVEACATTK